MTQKTKEETHIDAIEEEKTPRINLRKAISIVASASNPAKKVALERGVLYTSYNSRQEVSESVKQLPDSEKIFFSWSAEEKPDMNPWATMDKLGLSFLKNLKDADEIEISRKGVLDNAITYASNLRIWVDMAIRYLERPPYNNVLQQEYNLVMQNLAAAGALEKVRDIKTAEEFKGQINQALQELLDNYKKIEKY